MKSKSFLTVLGATLLLFFCSFSTGNAQNNPFVCAFCTPSLSPITVTPTLDDCTIDFQVSSLGNTSCTRLSYVWTTTDPLATVTSTAERAQVTFKSAGTFAVCVTFTMGFDANGDGIISAGEQCSVTQCTSVTVDCD